MFSPRIRWKQLAELSRRMAISTEAGIDVRKSWTREAEYGPWLIRKQLALVRDAALAGDSLTAGIERTGDTFPVMFRELVDVGEKTGSLSEVYRRLADHYDHQLKLRRAFLSGITWPMFQLSVAILVVGLLIWIMGIIAQRNNGQPIDLLGWGLVGTRGVQIYFTWVGAILGAIALVLWMMARGVFWTKPLQRAALFIPGVGGCLRTLCLARLAWALHLTMNVAMDLRKLIPLALRSTGNDYYIRLAGPIVADVHAGSEIHEALANTRAFPQEFLAIVEVGEQSGQLVESMGRLSANYEERAQASMALLTRMAGFAIWAMVAIMIIVIIFRLASFYLDALNGAMKL